jgi:hypothetical protein
MTKTKIVKTSPSHQLAVPVTATEKCEGTVVSYWVDSDVALQMSSYVHTGSVQVSADERLRDAIMRRACTRNIELEHIAIESCPDVAAATIADADGLSWTYCFAVWPDLAIFCLISGASKGFRLHRKWAIDAVRSITR